MSGRYLVPHINPPFIAIELRRPLVERVREFLWPFDPYYIWAVAGSEWRPSPLSLFVESLPVIGPLWKTLQALRAARDFKRELRWLFSLRCPGCGSRYLSITQVRPDMGAFVCRCGECGHRWLAVRCPYCGREFEIGGSRP